MRMKGSSRVVCLLVLAVSVIASCGGGGGGGGVGGGGGGGTPPPVLPDAPQDISATGANGKVTLAWSTVGGASSYNIYTNTTGSVTTSDTLISNATISYVHTGRTNGVTYYYRVSAVSSTGEGPLSNEVSAKPIPYSEMVQKIAAGDSQADDYFGYSVSISGDYAIVGGTGDPLSDAGAAYIFHRTGTSTWDAGTKITAPDAQVGDYFGCSVSISGDYAIVGAYGESGGAGDPKPYAGAAYIFHRTGTNTWDTGTKIISPDASAADDFGYSVSISGNYAIVGANGTGWSNEGAAYIFHSTGTNTWDAGTKIISPDAQANDWFGVSVSISGDYAIVGAWWEDGGAGDPLSDAGAAYIFHRTGTNTWNTGTKIVAPDAQADEWFGASVSINGDYAIVGAHLEDGGAGDPLPDKGAAYIFYRTATNTWDAGTKIMPPDAQGNNYFGYSVSISGDYAVIGAYAHLESDGTGDAIPGAGAAYIFHRTGTNTWDFENKITAPDAWDYDYFGYSVSISGAYVIVGAYMEDGGAGNPLTDAGAAYLFY